MPVISVVMTSYNHDKFLAEAIESVLSQTFEDIELIVVDDASEDRSREIICDFQRRDARVRSILHEHNQGISSTTNDGFSAARGQYIAYMQSDDVWEPDKLDVQLQILSQNRQLIVWSDASVIDGAGLAQGVLFTERCKATAKQKSGNLFRELMTSNFICGQSALFQKEVTERIRFDPALVYLNDYKFFLDAAHDYEFCFIDKALVKYRIHGDNSIGKNTAIWQKDLFRLRKYVLHTYGEQVDTRIKARLYYDLGRYLYAHRHWTYARKAMLHCILLNPWKTTYHKKYVAFVVKSLIH